MVWWPSYLHNGISYTGEMMKSLYWIRAHTSGDDLPHLMTASATVHYKGFVELGLYFLREIVCMDDEDNHGEGLETQVKTHPMNLTILIWKRWSHPLKWWSLVSDSSYVITYSLYSTAFKNAYELLNTKALKLSMLYKKLSMHRQNI